MRVVKIISIASALRAAQATSSGLSEAASNRNRLELARLAGSRSWTSGDREYENLMRSITMSLDFSSSKTVPHSSPTPSEFEWLPRGIADEGVELLVWNLQYEAWWRGNGLRNSEFSLFSKYSIRYEIMTLLWAARGVARGGARGARAPPKPGKN